MRKIGAYLMQKSVLTFYVLVILYSANTSLSAESTTDERDFYWWIQQLEQIRPEGIEIENARLTPYKFFFEIRAQSYALVSKFMLDIESNSIGIPQITLLRRRRIDEQPDDWPIPMMVEHASPSGETLNNLDMIALHHILAGSLKENPPPYLCLLHLKDILPTPGTKYYEIRKLLDEEYKSTTVQFGECELTPPGSRVVISGGVIDHMKRNEAKVEQVVRVLPGGVYATWHLKLRNKKGRWHVTEVTMETAIRQEGEGAREMCRVVDQALIDYGDNLPEGGGPTVCFPDQIDLFSIHAL